MDIKKIGELVKEWKVAIGILLLLLGYGINTFFQLKVENVEIIMIPSETFGRCPSDNTEIFAKITTNNKTGILKYQFTDIQNNKSFCKEVVKKNPHEQFTTDTINLKIDDSTNKAIIAFEYSILSDDFMTSLLDKFGYKSNTTTFVWEKKITFYCIKEVPDMTFIVGGNFNSKAVKGFYIDEDEVSIGDYYDYTKNHNKAFPFINMIRADDLLLDEKYRDFYPVLNIKWEEAKCYCESLDKRLPTSTELLYVVNGGKKKSEKNSIEDCLSNGILNFTELSRNSLDIRGINCNANEWCESDEKIKNKNLKPFLNSDKKIENLNITQTRQNLGFRCVKTFKNN